MNDNFDRPLMEQSLSTNTLSSGAYGFNNLSVHDTNILKARQLTVSTHN